MAASSTAGPLGDGGHGHYDQLSVEAAAAGRPLVVDPGRYTYDADDPAGWRHWFKGTAAHNTVCVDGLDQTPYRPGKPARASPSRPPGWSAGGPGPAWTCCGPRSAARATTRCTPARSRSSTATTGSCTTGCARRPRTSTRPAGTWRRSAATARSSSEPAGCPRPGLLLLAPHGTLRLADGWVSPSYGLKESAPVAVVAATGADVDLVTVLLPAGADADGHGRRAPATRSTVRSTAAGPVAWTP